ncbi:MAG: plasmid mobilization relaxosome protein MobC [Wujia sp.]
MNRTKQRMKQKHIEITEYEDQALKALMEKCGYRKEAHLIRDLIMNTTPISLPKETFDALTIELHKIGVNINQMAHMANATGLVDAQAFQEEAKKLDDLCFEIKKQVLEPFKRREIEEVVHDLQFMRFKTDEADERVMNIMFELEELLKGRV